MSDIPTVVYKILTSSQREQFDSSGVFAGSADDERDGFIHLSTASQVQGTLEKHFAGQSGLTVARISTARMGSSLKMEVSRGGALFPHLYRELSLSEVEAFEEPGDPR